MKWKVTGYGNFPRKKVEFIHRGKNVFKSEPKLIKGNITKNRYTLTEDIIGRTVEAVCKGHIQENWMEVPCTILLFKDGKFTFYIHGDNESVMGALV